MDLTITRFVLFEGQGPLKAFCDLCIGGVLLIRGIRVIAGRKGLFVSMPRQQSRNGKWYDSVVPLTKSCRAQIQQAVLEAFESYHLVGAVQRDGASNAVRLP